MKALRVLGSRARLAILLPLLAAGCNSGLIALVSGSSDGGSSGSQPVASDLEAPRAATSPATISFVVFDQDGQRTDVRLRYREAGVPGSMFQDVTLAPGSNPLTQVPSNASVPYEVAWDFAADLGSESYHGGLEIELAVEGGVSPPVLAGVAMGDDPPEVLSIEPLPAGAPEHGGNLDVRFAAADSAGDVLRIRVEYNDDAAGGYPDASWKLARPAATPAADPTPEYAVTGFLPDPAGTFGTFRWDTAFDLAGFDAEVRLRMTPEDAFGAGPVVEATPFRIDNNGLPSVIVQEGALFTNPDQRRAIGIPFLLFDDESDDVQVVLQWRRGGETYPALPDDPAEIATILADPALRETYRVATEIPYSVGGRVAPDDTLPATSVRLPEVAGEASSILSLGSSAAGDRLDILRAGGIPRAAGMPAGLLSAPVAALPLGDGTRALVLDHLPGAVGWRLREIGLARGEVLRDVASSSSGMPDALAIETGGTGALVAEEASGAWQLVRVDLATGELRAPLGAGSNDPPVRGLLSLGADVPAGTGVALVTAGSRLVRVDYDLFEGVGSTYDMLEDLAEPRGLVRDPLCTNRVYLAERGAASPSGRGRVRALDLDAYDRRVVKVEELGVDGAGFPRPYALALERGGARLLVVTDEDTMDGVRELRGVDIGGPEQGALFRIANNLPDGAAGIATGADGLRLLPMAGLNDFAIAGGLEQSHTLVGYDPAVQVATVAEPFDPPLGLFREWRWSKTIPGRFRTSPSGATRFLVWDSADLGHGGPVYFRATPYDADRGLSHAATGEKTVLAGIDGRSTRIEGLPVPGSVAIGDVNGDGVPDLVVPSLTTSALTVLYQSVSGEFPDREDVALGSSVNPYQVVVTDLDGDGKPDLASANSGSSDLRVFLQADAGGFSGTPDFVLGGPGTTTGARSLAAADLDGDGRMDLVSANGGSNNLTVFLQDPAGGFPPTGPSDVLGSAISTKSPVSVRTADLNGDGLLDVVSANQQGNNLTVFFQTGQTGSDRFPPSPSLTLGDGSSTFNPSNVLVADLDGDGLLDLVSANRFNSTATVFRQSPVGSFSVSPSFTLLVGTQPQGTVAGDFDGNGRQDLACSYIGGVGVFFQKRDGTYPTAPDLRLRDSGTFYAWYIASGDVDGDGRQDLAVADQSNGSVSVFLQAGIGRFPQQPDVSLALPSNSSKVGDLNGDGLLDVVSTATPGPVVRFQSSLGQLPVAPDVVLAGVPNCVAISDLNGDGRQDVVSGLAGDPPSLAIFFQQGAGVFPADPDVLLHPGQSGQYQLDVAAADFDGDGLTDLVTANGAAHNLTVYRQKAPGTFVDMPDYTLGGLGVTTFARAVVAADLNSDGKIDIASLNGGSVNLTVFFWQPGGGFPAAPSQTLAGASGSITGLVAEDLNGDGRLDLATCGLSSSAIHLYFQSALGEFPTSPSLSLQDPETIEFPGFLAAGDVNADGLSDLLVTNQVKRSVVVFPQTSPGRFPPAASFFVNEGQGTVSWVLPADMNADGELDVVSGGERLVVSFAE